MIGDWSFDELDEAAASIMPALPPVIFDIHAHLYRKATLNVSAEGVFATGPDEVTPDVWRKHVGRQVGVGRLSGALFLSVPQVQTESIDAVNAWVVAEAANCKNAKALAIVAPGMSPAKVEPLLDEDAFAGFKPYHLYASSRPTYDATPEGYIPEWVWPMANDRGLIVTLHLVRAGAMADAGNIGYLREHCEAFPGARVILAHAGRAFHAPNARAGIDQLHDLENLWFDTAAICEPEPLRAILEACGPRRLLWGSDFPISEQRGRCVTAGDGFLWITPDMVDPQAVSPCRLLPVGLESLRAVLTAAKEIGLDANDLAAIFAGNASRVLGLAPKTPSKPPAETQSLYRHARQRIPGGTQLLSKRPEMLAPEQWPAYFREARGCEIWDLDGRKYYDFCTHGIGACLLGFRDPDVTRAVRRQLYLGAYSTLSSPEEVALADRLCKIHPWADQVRFARTGGEALAVAVRIARATTDRSVVAVCGYHGWHDWYLAANLGENDALRGHLLPGLQPLGVPRELHGTCHPFAYNNREAFDRIVTEYGDRLAAVVMEPCRRVAPEPGFLEHIRRRSREVGALLVFDEVTAGWRFTFGGAHLLFGVAPDIAVFAKSLGNGHPIAAILGTAAAMDGAHASFISSTYWTDAIGPVAALATLDKMARADVPAHCRHVGDRVKAIWRQCAQSHGLPVEVPEAFPALAHFEFRHEEAPALKTLFTQMMLDRDFLAGTAVYACLAHTDALVDRYEAAVSDVFALLARAIGQNDITSQLRGPIAHSGFGRLA
ncbi:MAG: aminotransferase class III-fold pyridoxal phosphate-dependent enzyme [Thermoguttaceae bacterium]|jgi:glutamate-1-semialdehyde 2,1-aminomutase|nr:aminotransferase class III-fold pyridoxal phosphate-dependent enzyme [Thermoguttaceae bacterium]